jgi:hypothetical protein
MKVALVTLGSDAQHSRDCELFRREEPSQVPLLRALITPEKAVEFAGNPQAVRGHVEHVLNTARQYDTVLFRIHEPEDPLVSRRHFYDMFTSFGWTPWEPRA